MIIFLFIIVIDVGKNSIMTFPTKIAVLNSLEYINLDSMNVNYFPYDIFSIQLLKSLNGIIHKYTKAFIYLILALGKYCINKYTK